MELKPPAPLSIDGDVAVSFKKWKSQFEIYMLASGYKESTQASGERKVAILLHAIGPEAQETYGTLELTAAERKDWEKVLEKFEEHFKPQENETINRHMFNTRKQQEGETIESFVTNLKKMAENCNFDTLKNSLIRDRIVCGIIDDKVRNTLLQKATLSLTTCINICKAAELAGQLSEKLEVGGSSVQAIQNKGFKSQGQHKHFENKRQETQQEENSNKTKRCMSCGLFHGKRCPAYRKICRGCGKYNHFYNMCPKNSKKVHVVDSQPNLDSEEDEETDF